VAAVVAIALGVGSVLYLQNDDKQEVVASKVETTISLLPTTPRNNAD
jgi:ABC-type phosphate transport system permease subunit